MAEEMIGTTEMAEITDSEIVAPKDRLILSLKWSRGSDRLLWYAPDCRGYTENIDKAGRYSEAEVRSLVIKDVTVGVREREAYRLCKCVRYVPKASLREMLSPELRECEYCGAEDGNRRLDVSENDYVCDRCWNEGGS